MRHGCFYFVFVRGRISGVLIDDGEPILNLRGREFRMQPAWFVENRGRLYGPLRSDLEISEEISRLSAGV